MPKPSYPVILASTSLTSGIVAAWPLNEGSGTTATDIVGGAVLDCSGAGVSWNASPLGLLTNGAGSNATVATPAYLKLYPSSQPSLTLLWYGKVLGTLGGVGGFGGTADTSEIINYALDPFGGIIRCGVGTGGQNSSVAPAIGTEYLLIVTQDIGVVDLNINGTGTVNSNNLPGGISYSGTSKVFLGTFPAQADATNLNHYMMVVWDRAINDGEVASLNADPWQIFAPPMSLMPASLNSGGQICGSKYGILTGGRF